jgi:hypothetical protein
VLCCDLLCDLMLHSCLCRPAAGGTILCISEPKCVLCLHCCLCTAAVWLAVVLLLQALQSWRSTLGPDAAPSRVPTTSQERSAFKTALNNLRRGEGVDGLTMEVCLCVFHKQNEASAGKGSLRVSGVGLGQGTVNNLRRGEGVDGLTMEVCVLVLFQGPSAVCLGVLLGMRSAASAGKGLLRVSGVGPGQVLSTTCAGAREWMGSPWRCVCVCRATNASQIAAKVTRTRKGQCVLVGMHCRVWGWGGYCQRPAQGRGSGWAHHGGVFNTPVAGGRAPRALQQGRGVAGCTSWVCMPGSSMMYPSAKVSSLHALLGLVAGFVSRGSAL